MFIEDRKSRFGGTNINRFRMARGPIVTIVIFNGVEY